MVRSGVPNGTGERGRIIGEGCHFIDFLTFLAGAAPVSVSAQALPDLGRYRQDNALITLTFPDGSLGSLAYLANGDKSVAKERVEVFCGGTVAAKAEFRLPGVGPWAIALVVTT